MKQELMQEQSLNSNGSVEFQYLSKHIYEQLMQAHQKAQRFLQELGPLSDTPVLQSLLDYCKDIKLTFKTSHFVMELMEARLNKIIKNNKLKRNWSTEDLQILVWLISKYLEKNGIQSHEALTHEGWQKISAMIAGSTPKSCMFKFISLQKFKLTQHKWQKDEENLLFKIIEQSGTKNWKLISQKLYEQSSKKKIFRTSKQCREHWSCYLNPSIRKGPWQQNQDRKLLQTVLDNKCQKKWSRIKQDFEGRTQNALKNRYNLLIQKHKRICLDFTQEELLVDMLRQHNTIARSETQEVSQPQSLRNNVTAPLPMVPVIPEERRSNIPVSFHPGILIFFNPGGYHFSPL